MTPTESLATSSEIDRAAIFYWYLKNAYSGKCSRKASFGYAPSGPAKMRNYEQIKSSLKLAHERLSGVYIFNEDFYGVVKRFDRIDTLFYCDPPYYGAERDYECQFRGHEHLSECLSAIKGCFLLSYNDHETVRRLYKWATIEEVSTAYSCGNNRTQSKNKDNVKELLIRNF